jgi:acetyl-CoA C-acetyltransferase
MPTASIVEALRTAGGRRGGALREWHPADLGAAVLNALVTRSGIDPGQIEDVIVGCVSQVGEQSFHIGRNMVLASSLPDSVPAVSIDRQCGSSQQALHFAAQAVMSGTQDVVIAAGVEHMTRVPMGSPTLLAANAGLGTGPWPRSILDRYGVAQFSQFTGAEMIASNYGFSRDELDEFAPASHRKAIAATEAGAFEREIVVIDGSTRRMGIFATPTTRGSAATRRSTRWPRPRRLSRPASSPPVTPARYATAPRPCWWYRRRR